MFTGSDLVFITIVQAVLLTLLGVTVWAFTRRFSTRPPADRRPSVTDCKSTALQIETLAAQLDTVRIKIANIESNRIPPELVEQLRVRIELSGEEILRLRERHHEMANRVQALILLNKGAV